MENKEVSFDEFMAYLMVYAANVDFVTNEAEEQHIKSVVGDNNYYSMLDLFESHNDIESINFIQEQRALHIKDLSFDSLLNVIKEVFLVDNHFDQKEQALYHAFEKLA